MLEQRFLETPDGAIWSRVSFTNAFFTRYLSGADSVLVIARVAPVLHVPAGAHRADGNDVTFARLPYYVGPFGYLRHARSIVKRLRTVLHHVDTVVLRVPSQLAVHAAAVCERVGIPYGVEVVGDPSDVFAKGTIRHPLRPFLRWWFQKRLKALCMRAAAASYVSRRLRDRYPGRDGTFTTIYSSIQLKPEMIVSERRPGRWREPFRLITVASLEQPYKGVDVLLRATAECIQSGLPLDVVVIGEGRLAGELERLAIGLGVAEAVHFRGACTQDEVIASLDQSDLFVLPSRTEGLPRAMIEAMARGVPAIGTDVGGIPELLRPTEMVPPNDAHALARLITEVAADVARQSDMSDRGLRMAADYVEPTLNRRRAEFLEVLSAGADRRNRPGSS